MGDIVRRSRADLAGRTGGGDDLQPTQVWRGEGVKVHSTVSLGARPLVHVAWEVEPWYWQRNYRLLGFRSTSGFADVPNPQDLSKHGQRFLEATSDGDQIEFVGEGTHFYTLLLRGPRVFLCGHPVCEAAVFSATIPSARVAIDRFEQKVKLGDLEEEVRTSPLRRRVGRAELIAKALLARKRLAELRTSTAADPIEEAVRRAVDAKLQEVLVQAETKVELIAARQKLEKRIKKIPGWRHLSAEQQRKILIDIARVLNPAEVDLDPDN